MGKISLTRNVHGVTNLPDLQFQFSEIISRLEDYLNNRVDIHILNSKTVNQPRPSFKTNDLVFDLTISPGIATLQQWDGKKLVPLGFDTIVGFINLIERGIGSGTDPAKFLASNGIGGWELKIPSQIEFLAAELIPPFSLVTANGHIANSANLAHFNQLIGMTVVETLSGFKGQAVVDGEIFNALWAWSPSSKFFLNGSVLSLTAPSTGFSQLVAVARNSQTIIMKIAQAILL